jgi:hypothetical protein
MSRGVSTKLLTTLPAEYSADWLERLDKRTRIWRAILPRIHQLEEDAGGAASLSHAKRSLCRRAAFLELLCETQELRFTAGEPADVGAYTSAFNSMLGAYRVLGLERKARPAESLHSLMYRDEPESAGAESGEQAGAEAAAAAEENSAQAAVDDAAA